MEPLIPNLHSRKKARTLALRLRRKRLTHTTPVLYPVSRMGKPGQNLY